ncbi:MAG: hypothetical protein HUJ56_03605, partial [Erysipelotrichaceae bacterium]|nr:hypothetical protein [Erysipelotrichaceae bacterium]
GFVARRLQELVKKEHLEDVANFRVIPYYELKERQNEVDIAMLLPQIEPKAIVEQNEFSIPMYVIPFKAITRVKAQAFIEDAEDILALAKGKKGIQQFPNETQHVLVNRSVSHRAYEASRMHG